MKYKETGFRAFYRKFTVFMFTDTLREVTKNFPGAGQGNCILTYGYIDRSAGLTLEILAVGVAEKDSVTFLRAQMPIVPSSASVPSWSRSFSLWRMRTWVPLCGTRNKTNGFTAMTQAKEVELTRQLKFLDASP